MPSSDFSPPVRQLQGFQPHATRDIACIHFMLNVHPISYNHGGLPNWMFLAAFILASTSMTAFD